jgi:hypothetical protein
MKALTHLSILVVALFTLACSSSKKASQNPEKHGDFRHHPRLDANTFRLTEVSEDSTYGYKPENPIKVGGALNHEGPTNERRFLNALLGPKGEKISYNRDGSCCPFKTSNGFMGGGMLDAYEVTWEGLEKPITIYINMYDAGALQAPKGFTFKQ